MGSSISTSNKNSQSDDPWWSIEHEDYILEQPNISELFALLQENCANYKRKVKVIKPELSLRVQSTGENHHTVNEKEYNKLSTVQEQTLEEFKVELREKRMARQSAISDLRNEITSLKQQLTEEREIVRKLRNGEPIVVETKDATTFTDYHCAAQIQYDNGLSDIQNQSVDNQSSRSQLAEVQLALQLANADNLSLTTELGVTRRQVTSLKEVITCSKQMIEVREEQVNQLKAKLRQIEDSLAEREMKIMSESLRQEYDRQLANIRNLRQLYEERARVCAAERENLLRQISIKKDELAAEIERTKSLKERISSMENELETSNKKITSLQSECNEFKFENKSLNDEMGVINTLFSQMLMGFNGSNNLDIDQLTTMLEENRTLLNEMATKEDTSEGASLPKLLFDIVRQANNEETEGTTTSSQDATTTNQPEVTKVATAQEIIGNLPKVWRVLMELLNHHKIEKVQFKENGQSEDCYKSVQTPTGPKAELSVSKTYIKLKDLILEKKSLQKETNKLKTLNSHLERRLNEQEKRLSTVSLELTKTWHLVGKMQRQHRQLHTNEQILRYQLHQKRRLLNELKDELEYCRRKWAAARAKNAESQLQCDDLRKEFAKRKLEDANNSAESGYSDGIPSDDDDQPIPSSVKRDIHELFVHSKKIERMQSISPTRVPFVGLFSRGKSAPPTTTFLAEFTHTVDEISATVPLQNVASSSIVSEKPMATIAQIPSRVAVSNNSNSSTNNRGAVPKQGVRLSREMKRQNSKQQDEESLEEMFLRISGLPCESSTSMETEDDTAKRADRAERIQRLEEQCKSLIAQVIETAENREKLEIQLCKFQDELPPAQKPVPLEEYLAKKISDQKQDPFPETSELLNKATSTADKRHERLKKLEEESEQLMSKIKRTSDRTRNMKSRIEKIQSRSTVSREGSTDSSASVEEFKPNENLKTKCELTQNSSQEVLSEQIQEDGAVAITFTQENPTHSSSNEEECKESRSDRLRRLEEEGKLLLSKLNNNSEKGTSISSKLDELHSRYGSEALTAESEGSQGVITSPCDKSSPNLNPAVSLTAVEEAYINKRDQRLKRLEEEGKKLLNKLSHTNERGSELASRLDEIHEQAISRSPETDTTEASSISTTRVLNLEEDRKSCLGKLEEVQRRLEQSKKLLSQLSSDPDLNRDCTFRRDARRTQSESEASQTNPSNLCRLRSNVSRSQSESEASPDIHPANPNNSEVPHSENSTETTITEAEGNQSQPPHQQQNSGSD